jgi:hypothetical protein
VYRHGILLGRLYLAVDRGLSWRGWLCALLRFEVGFIAFTKVLHLHLAVGPIFINLKVL